MLGDSAPMRPALRAGSVPAPGVPRNIVRQELERHEAVQACVFGFVDHTHAAATEFFDDAVVGNRTSENR